MLVIHPNERVLTVLSIREMWPGPKSSPSLSLERKQGKVSWNLSLAGALPGFKAYTDYSLCVSPALGLIFYSYKDVDNNEHSRYGVVPLGKLLVAQDKVLIIPLLLVSLSPGCRKKISQG